MFSPSGIDGPELERMGAALAHRGPDDSAVWIDQQAGIGLAHRRLAVLDLTRAGRQPMVSADGRYVMVCNGEIYNHPELRREIERVRRVAWRGHCDSETLVEAIALWGLRPALERCVGMFALGLWDRRQRELSLARDRFGEKPLYFGYVGGDFAFASELRAVARLPGFQHPVDRHALAQFAARGYVPAPRSIFEGIHKLEPASTVTLAIADLPDRQLPKPVPYWSYRTVVEAGHSASLACETEALEALEAALVQAIRQQSVADVPVGLFLSGGIDSSTLLALHQAHGAGTMRTYSVGFAEARYDESAHARAVAAHFGTEHHEMRVDSADALAVIPRMSAIYDEPFADPAGIPTFLISKFARADVTVALSGDGGDELFAGYSRYRTAANLWRGLRRTPAPARKAIGKALLAVPPGLWDRMAPGRTAGARLQRTFRRLAQADGLADVYRSFRDEWAADRSPVLGASAGEPTDDLDLGDETLPAITRMMQCDASSYLPGDLLCKVDRATMANGLEARVPFLDHRVAEVASRIPLSMMVEGRTGKAILRTLLYRHAPRALFERPKAGFTVPVGEWLRGPLKSWAEDLLSHDRLKREGYFDADRIGQLWKAHKLRRVDAGLALWAVLMFQAWADNAPELGILGGF